MAREPLGPSGSNIQLVVWGDMGGQEAAPEIPLLLDAADTLMCSLAQWLLDPGSTDAHLGEGGAPGLNLKQRAASTHSLATQVRDKGTHPPVPGGFTVVPAALPRPVRELLQREPVAMSEDLVGQLAVEK